MRIRIIIIKKTPTFETITKYFTPTKLVIYLLPSLLTILESSMSTKMKLLTYAKPSKNIIPSNSRWTLNSIGITLKFDYGKQEVICSIYGRLHRRRPSQIWTHVPEATSLRPGKTRWYQIRSQSLIRRNRYWSQINTSTTQIHTTGNR